MVSRGVAILTSSLNETDPELYDLVVREKRRQRSGLQMIASENYIAVAMLQCLGSCLTNKYSEGLPGQRYYGGNEFIDKIERLCQDRALKAFNLNSYEWGVNVQPYSGTPANLAVYTALLRPHDRIMGLDLPDGGHLSHGFMTSSKRISATSIFFESMPYKVNPSTELIDYDKLAENAKLFKPKLIVAGISSYPRCLNYSRFREIADDNDAYLLADMSHVSGLVAAGVIPSPFLFSDVVTTTTHKTLRGPRSGLIFYRKGFRRADKKGNPVMYQIEEKINSAVFPGLQGGPHNHQIAAVATALRQTMSLEFKRYGKQIVLNAKALSSGLQKRGYRVVTNGTDVHLVLVDVRPTGLNGAKAEHMLESINIACNKNTLPGDRSALNPSGLRLGTPALTTRGMDEADMDTVATFIDRALQLAVRIMADSGPKMFEFKKVMFAKQFAAEVKSLKFAVENFAEKFPIPEFQEEI